MQYNNLIIKQFNHLTDIRQTKEYAGFMSKIGWQTKQLYDKQQVRTSSLCQIYIKKLPLLPFSVIKILRCHFPKTKNKTNKLFKEVEQIGKKHKALFIKLQPFDIKNLEPGTLNLGFRVDNSPLIPTKTIWLDLTKTKNQLLKNMKQKTRYNIKLALKNNLKTKKVSGDQVTTKQLIEFYNLWKKNKPFNWLFKPSFNELKHLVKSFNKNCFFIFIYPQLLITNYSLLAGVLILNSSSISFYWHNCSSKKGRKLMAPSLAVWQAVLESKKRNLKVFDLEGIWDKRFPKLNQGWQGFSKFKKGFGGQEILFSKPFIIKNY